MGEDEQILSQREIKQAENFAARIKLGDAVWILQYGAGAQKRVADCSEKALERTKTKESGEIDSLLKEMISQLRDSDQTDERNRGFFRFFRKRRNTQSQYQDAEGNINRIMNLLEKQRIRLMKDAAVLDQIYERNQDCFKELSMYILAGKKKIDQARNEELERMKTAAIQSGLHADVQAVRDYAANIDRFEKRVHDLELTKIVSLQMAPQIRLIQSNDIVMTEKIRSVLVNTIPLWKNKRLVETNAVLIETLDDAVRIQSEGKEKRRQAENDLAAMKQQIEANLPDISC